MILGIRISSLWNPKAARWWSGRKNWKNRVRTILEKQNFRIWFHVSSLGEFEQARPVMEDLKRSHPEIELILSFFSPSGYEIRKDYALVNEVLYLPADIPGNAEKWLSAIQPDFTVFVKYDLWPGYLRALVKHQIPFCLISAHFKSRSFSSWSIPPTKSLLKKAGAIFLQEDSHVEVLKRKGFNNIRVAGDTRIDRTLEIARETASHLSGPLLQWGTFDLIAGSTWEQDESLLFPIIEKLKLKVILAPHEVSASRIARIIQNIHVPVIRLSDITDQDRDIQVVVVDSIGRLAYLYALGRMAYVGGGFGRGIHNILEPAAHHLPLIFGPHYQKFPEAVAMVKSAAARSVQDEAELLTAIRSFSGEKGKEAGLLAQSYLEKNKGATQTITSYLRESIPFAGKS